MSDSNTNRSEDSSSEMTRRKAVLSTGAGAILFSSIPSTVSASSGNNENSPPGDRSPGPREDTGRPDWVDEDWESKYDPGDGPDEHEVSEEELAEAMANPDNWELYVHGPGFENERRYVGENRNAEPPSNGSAPEVTGQASFTEDILCGDLPYAGEGCVSATGTAYFNKLELDLSVWGYSIYGGELSWVNNTFTISFKFTAFNVKMKGSAEIALEKELGENWEVCITPEICVYWQCLNGTGCFNVTEP